jgi:alpha-L-fucosidase
MSRYLFFILLVSILNRTVPQSTLTSCSNFRILKAELPMDSVLREAAHVCPSERQVAWQELEFTVFIHFGMNTFTGREWGLRNEDPAHFNPAELDAGQWARTAKMAGAKLLIMVAKHHDGFCLWQTKYTDYSVKQSPWKEGNGDVIAEVAAACREQGIKLGIYMSPWDISSPIYGTDFYNEHFINQLRELLTQYGEISEVWFDGACGEGPNGKRQLYDWTGYYQVVRELQPDAVIAIMGPDVRWVGTESGYGRETEWSVIPISASFLDKLNSNPNASIADGIFDPPGDLMEPYLGSREKLQDAAALMWYPSEVDVSIRPGWFYHDNEDSLVKSPEKLVDIYFSSVGRNSVLLLNLPPDKRGLIHENDIKSLEGMTTILEGTFKTNLAQTAKISIVSKAGTSDIMNMVDEDNKTFWQPNQKNLPLIIEFDFGTEKFFDCLKLQENFRNGQRVENFILEIWQDGNWQKTAEGTTIGYQRLLRFEPAKARKARLVISAARDIPEISTIGFYKTAGPISE